MQIMHQKKLIEIQRFCFSRRVIFVPDYEKLDTFGKIWQKGPNFSER
jgi:hypothetical protein